MYGVSPMDAPLLYCVYVICLPGGEKEASAVVVFTKRTTHQAIQYSIQSDLITDNNITQRFQNIIENDKSKKPVAAHNI